MSQKMDNCDLFCFMFRKRKWKYGSECCNYYRVLICEDHGEVKSEELSKSDYYDLKYK